MKLPLREAGHEALLKELAKWDGYVASALLGVEAVCACRRYGEEYGDVARAWLLDVALLPIESALLDHAASLQPRGLRSLDAIHLATALSVRADIGAFCTYDERLARAAAELELPVVQPV